MKRCFIAILTLLLLGGLAVASCPAPYIYPAVRQRAVYYQQHYVAPVYYPVPIYRVSVDDQTTKLHELIEKQTQLIETLMMNGPGGAALTNGPQVFALKCASCHSAAPDKSGKGTLADVRGNGFVLLNEDGSATNLSKNDARRILVRLTHPDPLKRMPPGGQGLPGQAISAVKKHLDENVK